MRLHGTERSGEQCLVKRKWCNDKHKLFRSIDACLRLWRTLAQRSSHTSKWHRQIHIRTIMRTFARSPNARNELHNSIQKLTNLINNIIVIAPEKTHPLSPSPSLPSVFLDFTPPLSNSRVVEPDEEKFLFFCIVCVRPVCALCLLR